MRIVLVFLGLGLFAAHYWLLGSIAIMTAIQLMIPWTLLSPSQRCPSLRGYCRQCDPQAFENLDADDD